MYGLLWQSFIFFVNFVRIRHDGPQKGPDPTNLFYFINFLLMNKRIFWLLLFVAALFRMNAAPHDFKIENGKFLLDGKSLQLICGEMHYPRIPQEYWRDRIRRAKAMGINTVSTYVFWNIHERRPGEFDFTGQADLARFVRTAQEEGMYVVLRPGPYVCAEWDFGGYPYWLQKNKDMVWRSDNPAFLAACKRYIDRLGKELASLTVTNGGPILLVQVENEYGSYASDRVYLGKLRDMIREAGFNVPLITCDGAGQMPNGWLEGALPTVNGAVGEDIMKSIDRFHKGGPYFVAEFYPAWFDVWGKRHSRRNHEGPARQLDWMLSHGVSISMYMFHGGTNFSYTNGANDSYGYEPQPTSYDYDAPLGEYGNPTPKYHAFREVIGKYLPEGETLPDVPELNPVATFAPVELTETAPLRAAFGRRVRSEKPLTMEDVDMDFGYIHYETVVKEAARGMLVVREPRDYAVVYVNGKRIGSLDRRHRQNKLEVDIPAGARLEILVENVGRINYGAALLQNRKGITEKVTLCGKELKDWTVTPLPLYASVVPGGEVYKQFRKSFRKATAADDGRTTESVFRRGTFRLDKSGDVFLDMRGWGKGAVWVNGRSIGKHWNIGPQHTLYVPGPWVKKGKNEIVVLDFESEGRRAVAGLPEPILDSLGTDRNRRTAVKRDFTGTPVIDEGDMILADSMQRKDGWQRFDLKTPATLRHLCLEVLTGYDGKHSCLSELVLRDKDGKELSKDDWKIAYVSTEEPVEGNAELLADDNVQTYWHSQWKDKTAPFPHRIIIDLGEIQTVATVEMRQRGASMPGCVKDFRLYGRPQFFLFK